MVFVSINNNIQKPNKSYSSEFKYRVSVGKVNNTIKLDKNMNKTLLLYICGFYNLSFAVFHIYFWKIFKWKEDLKRNSIANRAIIQILNIRLIYVFLLMAFIYFFVPDQLIATEIGFILLIGFLGFWIGRFIEQFIFLRVKSKMAAILTIIFFIGIIIHLLPVVT